MEQKKINNLSKDLSKKYQQEYEQSKLKYEVAKVFFDNIPFWKYANSFFLISIGLFVYTLGYIIWNNQMDKILLLFINYIFFCICVYIIMIPAMGWIKPNKKYFHTVLNQINKKSKCIELKETGSKSQEQVRIVVNEILNTLNNNDKTISYLDIYDVYKKLKNQLRRNKNRLKNLDNDIDIIIKKQKQKENIQEYIKEYIQDTKF